MQKEKSAFKGERGRLGLLVGFQPKLYIAGRPKNSDFKHLLIILIWNLDSIKCYFSSPYCFLSYFIKYIPVSKYFGFPQALLLAGRNFQVFSV